MSDLIRGKTIGPHPYKRGVPFASQYKDVPSNHVSLVAGWLFCFFSDNVEKKTSTAAGSGRVESLVGILIK